MNNVKIQFECEPSEYMELRDKEVWVDVRKQLIIKKNMRSKRKEGWIEKLVTEIEVITRCDYITFYETNDAIIVDFYDFILAGGEGSNQEDCCRDLHYTIESIKKVIRKFRINKYELIHIFRPEGITVEEQQMMYDEYSKVDAYDGDMLF